MTTLNSLLKDQRKQRDEKTKTTKTAYVKLYEDLLWIIVYAFGGVCFSVHLSEILKHKNYTETHNILNRLEKNNLIDVIHLSNNNIIKVKAFVLNYFLGKQRTVQVNTMTIQRAAILGEYYCYLLKYYEKNSDIKGILNMSNLKYFDPDVSIKLLSKIMKHYEDNNWDISIIDEELVNLNDRRDYNILSAKEKRERKFAMTNYRSNSSLHTNLKLEDLYTLSCNNIFIRKMTRNKDQKNVTTYVSILNVNSYYEPKQIARLFLTAFSTLNYIFNPSTEEEKDYNKSYSKFKITLYSLDREFSEEKVRKIVKYFEQAQVGVAFTYNFINFNAKSKLFANRLLSNLG